MSNGMEKRKGSVLPADGLQRGEEQELQQSGKKLRIRAVFSALLMLI